MKRLVKISALAALAVSLAFSTVACSDGDDDDSTTPTADAPSTVDTPGTDASQSNDDSNSTTTTTTPTETPAAEQTVTVDAAWDFTSNKRDGDAVDGVSATKGGSQPTSEIELTTNKTGSGATMKVLTATKCEWNGKLQFSTGTKDYDLFTITADADCTAVIKVGSASSSKSNGKVNALKLGDTVIFNFDTVDTKADAVEKTVSLTKGENKFTGSGITISTVKLSN